MVSIKSQVDEIIVSKAKNILEPAVRYFCLAAKIRMVGVRSITKVKDHRAVAEMEGAAEKSEKEGALLGHWNT